MIRSVTTCVFGLVWCAQAIQAAEPQGGLRYPAYVSGYELATHDDMLYRHLLDQLIAGDEPGNWPLVTQATGQLGSWIGDYLTADRIASIITAGMAIEGQAPLKELDRLVGDCAKILKLPKPACFIRNSPEAKIYATEAGGRPMLVLTSGMVKLYQGEPDELRFIVGRELGHIKCDHIHMRTAATGIIEALRRVDMAAIPSDYKSVLPTFALGQLFTWARESEISADRAGLLCCQDPEVACQALLRLLHGLDRASVGEESPIFDPIKATVEFDKWQSRPLVEFLTEIKRSQSHAPFIPERIAALKFWAELGHWQTILDRKSVAGSSKMIVIKQVDLLSVASPDSPANPYLVAYDGSKKLFTSPSASGVTSARWKDIDVTRACNGWRPIFFEIWNDSFGGDELLGGFVLYPDEGREKYATRIIWDWKDRVSVSRIGMAEVRIELRDEEK